MPDDPMSPHRSLSFRESQMIAIDKWRRASGVFQFNEAVRQLVELGLASYPRAEHDDEDDPEPENNIPIPEFEQVPALTICYAPGWRKWLNEQIADGKRSFTRQELFAQLPDQNKGQASTPREIDAYFSHSGWIASGTNKRIYRFPN